MKPEYILRFNHAVIASWDDLQLACECSQAVMLAYAVARTEGTVFLHKRLFGTPVALIIEASLKDGSYDLKHCSVNWNGSQFSEVDLSAYEIKPEVL